MFLSGALDDFDKANVPPSAPEAAAGPNADQSSGKKVSLISFLYI